MADANGHGVGSVQVTQNDQLSHCVDLFEGTKLERSVIRGKEVFFRPVNMSNDGPFEFQLPSQGNQYLQLGSFRLYGKTRIHHIDGDDLTKDEVGVINMFPASLFEDITVTVNGVNVMESGSKAAHYKNYIETILSYGRDARDGWLSGAMFAMDDAGDFEIPYANAGWVKHLNRLKESRVFDWEMPVCDDFLRSDRVLPNGIDLKIVFHRSRTPFSLMGPKDKVEKEEYVIEFKELKLYARMLEMDPSVAAYHQHGWNIQPYIYPINKTTIHHFLVPAGGSYCNIGPIFSKQLPKTVVVGMVDTKAFQGCASMNPWNFQHFWCNKINLNVATTIVPSEPYRPDFYKDLYAREFSSLFQNTGLKISNEGNCITRDHFANGCFLTPFDLTADNCNGFHAHTPQEGSLLVEIEFATELKQSITVIVYSVFDSELKISKNREATVSHVI